jgi:hypothetical protein
LPGGARALVAAELVVAAQQSLAPDAKAADSVVGRFALALSCATAPLLAPVSLTVRPCGCTNRADG